jgi:hypothetical protein
MKFDKILIGGCSYTSGYMMPEEHSNPNIWANQLAKKLNATTVTNVSKTGANNHWIFLEIISELIKNEYDLVLVEWSVIPRYKFKVGLELYTVDSMLNQDVNVVGQQTFTKKWLMELKDCLLKIHNDHWDILDLVKYINTLIEIQQKSRQGQIFFINGMGPWADQYFVKKQINLPSDLDSYTYDLLQADIRDDNEIFQLYDMIHAQYKNYGGIHDERWLNLYQSMDHLKIDTIGDNTGITDTHPGIASQTVFVNYFYQHLQDKLRKT